MKKVWVFAMALAGCGTLLAQEMNPTATDHWPQQQGQQPSGQTENGVPIYKITVVGRNIPAINYFHRSGATKVGFRGTELLPQAKGSAEVNSLNGRTQIKVHMEGLIPANSFGVEYLTYVLWAITPEGRPINLGEVLWSKSGKADTTVTTNLQSFGMILTAEPYFAVTMPSDVVVMQNFVINDRTTGVLETVNAHYNLLPRGVYAQTEGRHSVLHPITRNDRSPLDLYEAINAVQIADAEGAEQYAPDSMASAKQDLYNARQMDIHQKEMKQEITYAREAVQTAEDSRILTIRKKQADEQAAQRAAEEAAKKQAQASALAAQAAQQQQQQAEQQAEAAQRQQQQAEAAAATAQAEQAKAQAAQQAAEQAMAQARQQAEQMREKLRDQLNSVLNTQETARGLIVNMSDVLFAFNKFDLKTDAQIKLAKVSGILLTYPNLKVQVEGYTDNVGSAEYNQQLSEKRAMAVQSFLIAQGVPPGNVTAQGFGPADPVADNSTSAGRAQNRRVEMVVSGQSIGVQEQAPTPANSQPVPPGTAPITAQPPPHPQSPPPGNPPQPQQPQNPTGTSQGPPQ
ncbi:MAG TPA: OmpA family protein [Acidobacteriaceae bacterium]|jgi:outer membrane protein OmpA-like peptidoglycan-associated protein|nr:OmpA family protein [Acidobacteriaceae bacterium]